MKVGDKVKITSLPLIEDAYYSNMQQRELNRTGTIVRIFKHGERNIVVGVPGHIFSTRIYLKSENIELL